MSIHYSKVRIAGHPVHPMLIAFPVTFYTATLLGFAAYAATIDLFWWRLGLWSNAAGVLTALIAAIPGFIDWAAGIPKGHPAKATGRVHMLFNVVALVLFTINLIVQTDKWVDLARTALMTGDIRPPNPTAALLLSGFGVLCTLAAGFFGWKLVQTHHVGVELSEQQSQLEPAPFEPRGRTRHGGTLA